MIYTNWLIPKGRTVVPEALTDAGFLPLLAAVLHVRGLDDPDAAREFLDSSPALLGDPLLLTDMPQAVGRLARAIAQGEKVAVYGDYDVDGITSSCMLTDYLRSRGTDCTLYIPDRLTEGYGVNAAAIEKLAAAGVTLIVTVDCGVTTVDEAARARELGVDMVITDHHECQEPLPDAVAVVDHKRPDCNYPNHDLAGVGVAFKLLCALEGDAEGVLRRYADLVAVGTIADVMPLVGENRYIVKRGLEKLEADPRPGLRALLDETGLSGKRVTATNVGFTLAPRLNASGRLGQVRTATELLLTDDPRRAAHYAEELCQLNRDRQALETDIWQQALEQIGLEKPDAPLVLASEEWHQGVIGIAASRLSEAFGVPSIMIRLDSDKGKGSCRSCGGFNLFEALSACAEHLEGFGGHALAAGLTIRRENIPAFRAAMAEYYRAHPAEGGSTLELDLAVDDPALLDMLCVEELDRLEPCGAGNPRCQLALLGARVTELTPIGGGKHLRLRFEKFGRSFDAVFFSHTAQELGLRAGDWVDAAFYPQINTFRSRRSVQLLISDLRKCDDKPLWAILNGEMSPELAPFAPERGDFVRVWRALSARGGALTAPLREAQEQLGAALRQESFCLCLKILEELGLVTLSAEGGELAVRSVPGAQKVDLASSRILRSLRDERKAQ